MNYSANASPPRLRGVLVGLGGIAWKLAARDLQSPLTHAGVLQRNASTELVGGFSPVKKERDLFFEAFGVPAFGALEEMLDQLRPDIVSICSPSENHADDLDVCLRGRIKKVWLEKPAASTVAELQRLIELRSELGSATRVLVNFQRRYMASYRLLRSLARRFSCRHIGVVYSRGLEANGSHMADILSFITGDRGDIVVEASNWNRGEPAALLRSGQGVPISFVGADLPYHNIDIALTFEQGRVSVVHGGMTLRCELRCEHELFPGFFRLKSSEERDCRDALLNSMPRALADLIRETPVEPCSNLSSALHGAKILDSIAQCANA